MRTIHAVLAGLLVSALLLGGCSKPAAPKPPGTAQGEPAGQKQEPQRTDLVQPIEAALLALKAMNETGKQKDFVNAEKHFLEYRTHWAVVRAALEPVDARLAQHLEDGAVELDHEFTKPTEEIRVYELDEETVKLGRLLSSVADLLNVPIRPELVQRAPTEEFPYNEEVRVEVTLVDHKIQPEVIELAQHTKVTFVVTNKGKDVHEFEIGYYALELEDIKPGETKELTFVLLDAGEFETACHVPGHYEVGMYGKLVVKPAELKAS